MRKAAMRRTALILLALLANASSADVPPLPEPRLEGMERAVRQQLSDDLRMLRRLEEVRLQNVNRGARQPVPGGGDDR